MRISLVFPFILFIALRLRIPGTLLVAAGCAAVGSAAMTLLEDNLVGGTRMIAWCYTLSSCGIFLLGAGLARRYRSFTDTVDRLSPIARLALLVCGTAAYLYPPPSWHRINMGDFCIACGGLVLLTFALRQHGVAAALLRLRPMQFLGTISYSLYLLHFPILMLFSSLSSSRFSFGWLLLPFLTASILAAVVMHRLVEVPSMALGQRVRDLNLPTLQGFSLGGDRSPLT